MRADRAHKHRARVGSSIAFALPASLPVAAAGLWLVTDLPRPLAFAVSLTVAGVYCVASVILYKRMAAAMARQIDRIEDEIRTRLSGYDPAASVFSRGYFEARLAQEIKRSARYELPMSIITISMLPEVHGWVRADWEVFSTEIVTTASRLLRSEDVLGYLGGLEYTICLPHTETSGAEIVLNRIAEALERYTPLVGLAGLSPESASPGELIDRAKKNALQRSRTARNNQSWNELDEVA